MKKIKYLLIVLLLVASTLIVSSCNNKERHVHTYGEWTTIKEPTESEEGSKERECSGCHNKETKSIPKLLKPTEGLSFKINSYEDSFSVTGIGTAIDVDIVIPSLYNNLPVTRIEEQAFSNCSNLKSITIPSSVKVVENQAFQNCSNLTSITIPDSVTYIGYDAFEKCVVLSNVYYEGSIEEWCRLNCSIFKNSYRDVPIEPFYAPTHFYLRSNEDWEELTSIEIPNTIAEIGDYQFYGFNHVTSIKMPNSIERIGESAFQNCSRLTSIVIPNSVRSIGVSAFAGCSSLTSVVIPNSVRSIGVSAFASCSSLTSVVIPNSVTSIGESSFSGCYRLAEIYNLSNLNIEKGKLSNGGIGFYAKVIHKSLDEPSKIITKDDYVFVKDNGNEYYLLGYNGKATDLVLPNDIEGNNYKIEKSAFSCCRNLTSIVIPNSVTSIEWGAFFDCTRLVEIYNLSSLNITIGRKDENGEIGVYAKEIHTSLEEESKLITKDDYVFIIDDENKYYLIAYNGTATELILPNDINGDTYEINQYAFYKNYNLSSITIPNSVTSIGDFAFHECISLTSVTTGNSIISIGDFAFYHCSSLTSIVIPNSAIRIENRAFLECNSLTSIVMSDSVTSIGQSAFYNCNSLKEVFYKGTSTKWTSISIESDNENLTSAAIYYYSETKPVVEGNYWHYVDGVVTKW